MNETPKKGKPPGGAPDNPITPKSQIAIPLFPEALQAIPAELDSTPTQAISRAGTIASAGSNETRKASSSTPFEENLHGENKTELEATREIWKKRKQALLAEAQNVSAANLQLHGLRPPPPHSRSFQGSLAAQQAHSSVVSSSNNNNVITHPSLSSAASASKQSAIVRWQDPSIRDDLYRILAQFCEEEGLTATKQSLAEEWMRKARERDEAAGDARKLKKVILDGKWEDVEKLLAKSFVRNNNALKYAIFKQQYLEYIEQREYQKAFTFLQHLRELEHYQPFAGEFRDLCYLLSGKSVADAPSFRAWDGVRPARAALVARLEQELNVDDLANTESASAYVPPNRLKTLMHQAVAYQVEFSRYHPKKAPHISTLLYDYESFVCPNAVMSTMRGHSKNVKAVAWVGLEGRSIISGSSDGTLRIWRSSNGQQQAVLQHGSRVWDVATADSGQYVASAGGHALVRLWNVQSQSCIAKFGGDNHVAASTGEMLAPTGDVYSCAFDGSESHLLTGGYDKIVRLYDLATNTLEKTFTGHALGVSSVTFDRTGRLAATASKDCSVRLWDLNSGLCVRVVYGHLGECTSVAMSESGREMLTASKDNSSMLHDMRILRPVQRYKGAQNTRANFVRASFANKMIASGSEDGQVYLWDQESAECLQTLNAHGGQTGTVYCAAYNQAQSLLASCGDDGAVRTWYWDEAGQESGTSNGHEAVTSTA